METSIAALYHSLERTADIPQSAQKLLGSKVPLHLAPSSMLTPQDGCGYDYERMPVTFYRIEDRHIPLNALELVRLDRNATGFGYFIPQHSHIGHSLIEGNGKSLIIIPLDGDKAFRHFSMEIGAPIRGVLFRDINLAIDLRSSFNCRAAEHLGAITVSGGKACLTTSSLRDGFGDPMPFPLPLDAIGDDDPPIGFRQWSITKRVGDDTVELWKSPVPDKD